MKKIIALALALCMVLSATFALADETQELKDARSYINLMYKNKPASTPKDYTLIGSVPGDNETFTVEWTTDSDTIVITRQEDGLVKINVDENNPKEVAYKLTATVKDAAGNESSISFDRFVPAAINLDVMTEEEIVEVAYGLDDGAALPTPTVLTGTIVAIPSAYSEQYDNITVNIQVGDLADKPIQCYRLIGGSSLKEGDEITVIGTIKNYKGTIEFDKGCYTIEPEFAQSARVVLFAYSLEDGASLDRESTVTGMISAIPSAYSADYGNITVNIDVPGLAGGDYTVQCYRLAGGEGLAEGDIITVTGTIKNYKGTIEFDKGCTYVPYDASASEAVTEQSEQLSQEEFEKGLDAFLADIMGMLGSQEGGSENQEELLSGLGGLLSSDESGEGEGLSGLLSGLGGLFGAGESGEGEGLSGLLSGLGGLFGTGESGEDLSGLLSGLGGLFGTGESGEDLSGLLSGLGGLFGAGESGEGEDLSGLLNGLGGLGGLFGTGESGESEDLNGLLNGLFGLFTQE